MKHNIGKTDRAIRIVIGLAIIIVGYYYQSWWGLVGIVLILIALTRVCPLFVPFGFSTCGKDESCSHDEKH